MSMSWRPPHGLAGTRHSKPTVSTASSNLRSRLGPAYSGAAIPLSLGGKPSGPNGLLTVRVFLLDGHEIVRRGLR